MQSLTILQPENWPDYELLDTGNGEKLERYGRYVLRRPDPQIIWKPTLPSSVWNSADATFVKSHGDKGNWRTSRKMPEYWLLPWHDLKMAVRMTPFKHTGVFPEQSAHWAWMMEKLATQKKQQPDHQPHILNLFAYTGMASVVCAHMGAKITHVDASKPSISWAKQNQLSSGLDERSIRWILDDVLKFVSREVKRGVKYDGIIMDPPVYGHGPTGEIWDFSHSFPQLLDLCNHILVDNPLFIIVNAYAISSSALTLGNVMQEMMGSFGGSIETGELVLQESSPAQRLLSTGIFVRWSK